MNEQLLMILPMEIVIVAFVNAMCTRCVFQKMDWNNDGVIDIRICVYVILWLLAIVGPVSSFAVINHIFPVTGIMISAISALTSLKMSITINMVYSERRRRTPSYNRGEDPIFTYENLIRVDILLCIGFWMSLVANSMSK